MKFVNNEWGCGSGAPTVQKVLLNEKNTNGGVGAKPPHLKEFKD
jgi:hypothetical protein